MKDIFLHGAIDLMFFTLFVVVLFNKVPFFSLAWIINIIFLIGTALIFIYDIASLGEKIEKYINRDNKEN